jgi:hypothetical protein
MAVHLSQSGMAPSRGLFFALAEGGVEGSPMMLGIVLRAAEFCRAGISGADITFGPRLVCTSSSQ